jgi:predicted DsbA family dithiol-disulfide isomerase
MIRTHSVLAIAAALALSACNGAAQKTPAGDATPVARIGEETITASELDAWIKDQLWRDQTDDGNATKVYGLRQRGLDSMIDQRLLEAEATKRGLDADALLDSEAAKRVAVSDVDVKTYFDEHQDQLGGQSLEELAPRIKEYLERSRGNEAAQAFVAELRTAAGVELLLEQPRVAIAGSGHAQGPEDAKVIVVEFSDYECPFCRRAEPVVEQMLKEYAGRVRFEYRHFPLESLHKNARAAAAAAICADEQGKFWAYHGHLFGDGNQGFGPEQLLAYAQPTGLDVAAFQKCLASNQADARIDADLEAGRAAGVSGTPAFFVNGIPFSGAIPIEEFRKVIDAELAKG